MSTEIEIIQAGPGMSIQDRGRPGFTRYGLSAGGAMDRFALEEAAVLLDGNTDHSGIEFSGMGGSFVLHGNPRWCCTAGAPMHLALDGKPIPWRSNFRLHPEQTLVVGAAERGDQQGTFGYLFFAGGCAIKPEIGATGTHLRAGVGGLNGGGLEEGDRIPLADTGNRSRSDIPHRLPAPGHLGRNRIRIVWGAQSSRFKDDTREQLLSGTFTLSHRRDRMAMRLEMKEDDARFEALLGGLSDPIQAGDIQMTGDGIPAILMREHQPTGGYPRIASVITADLDAAAQLPGGRNFQFELVSIEEAVNALRERQQQIDKLPDRLQPVVRSPDQISNLLDYNLIDGVVSASN